MGERFHLPEFMAIIVTNGGAIRVKRTAFFLVSMAMRYGLRILTRKKGIADIPESISNGLGFGRPNIGF